MQTLLLTSLVILWLVVLVQGAAVVAITRQLGIIYERIAPMGALVIDQGPEAGTRAPELRLRAIDGASIAIGIEGHKEMLLFFVSPTCPVCKKMLPIVKSVVSAEHDWLQVVIASDGESTAMTRFHSALDLGDIPFVVSAALGQAFRVGRLPHAVLIDRAGVIRAKGLINTREHLESLFTAMQLGVDSLQQFAARENSADQKDGLKHVGT